MQVLLGLQSNALKFTQNGIVKIVARIDKSDILNEYLVVDVEDTGIGISE
jgi:signal transduction histidine kinase